jgi:hypothetical protein
MFDQLFYLFLFKKKGSEIVASAELEQRLQSSVNTVAETVISADCNLT